MLSRSSSKVIIMVVNINAIFNEALAIMAERAASSTVYCGWGTTMEWMIDDYLQQGGSSRLVRKVLNTAYYNH